MVPLLALIATTSLTGCFYKESVCGRNEYPVKLVNSPTGGYCVPDGEEPTSGYVRYPAGKVPKEVGDEWDLYWQHRILDANGNEVGQPSPSPSTR
jgi:hypothetical protein